MAMENPAAAQTLLMQMRALGVRVSVDDFGTGPLRARLSPPVPAGLAEGRSLLRAWHRGEPGHGEHPRRREHDDAAARTADGGRGHREGRAAGADPLAGLRVRARLPVFQAGRSRSGLVDGDRRPAFVTGADGGCRGCGSREPPPVDDQDSRRGGGGAGRDGVCGPASLLRGGCARGRTTCRHEPRRRHPVDRVVGATRRRCRCAFAPAHVYVTRLPARAEPRTLCAHRSSPRPSAAC